EQRRPADVGHFRLIVLLHDALAAFGVPDPLAGLVLACARVEVGERRLAEAAALANPGFRLLRQYRVNRAAIVGIVAFRHDRATGRTGAHPHDLFPLALVRFIL